MNAENAQAVLDSVVGIWEGPPMGPEVTRAWAETLRLMEFDRARRAVRDLSTTEPRRPTVARFRQAYQAQGTPSTVDPRRAEGCATCSGSGYVDADLDETYRAVVECPTCQVAE